MIHNTCVWYWVNDKAVFVFVGDANAHHSEWLESVSPNDRLGRGALEFCNLSDCEQLMRCLTHIAGNRLDLVMTDAHDVVDVFLGTHCALPITALSVVWFVLINLCRSTM